MGTPIETLNDEHAEDRLTGALLLATLVDETRATRIYLEGIVKALSKKR